MADLKVDTIASSGGGLETLTNEVVKRSGPVIAQGVATFTNANNNINLAGLGIHPEVGDVLLIDGSVNNGGAFTAEFITDNDNVVVNAAHAGGTTSKSLVDETATVTVTLLAKWFQAPIGLGRGWVNLTGVRFSGVPYTNGTGRDIKVLTVSGSGNSSGPAYVSGDLNVGPVLTQGLSAGSIRIIKPMEVLRGDDYSITAPTIDVWWEMR